VSSFWFGVGVVAGGGASLSLVAVILGLRRRIGSLEERVADLEEALTAVVESWRGMLRVFQDEAKSQEGAEDP
jgi:hypothetical protein